LAEFGLGICCDIFLTRRDLDRFRLPEREGIDRRSRPRTARVAMAIAHGLRGSGGLDFDGAAKTASAETQLPALGLAGIDGFKCAHGNVLSVVLCSVTYAPSLRASPVHELERAAIARRATSCKQLNDIEFSAAAKMIADCPLQFLD